MSLSRKLGCLLFISLAAQMLLVGSAPAALIVQIQDAQIVHGGSTFIDVLIDSSASDPLQTFDFEVTITPIGPVTSALQFNPIQPDPQLTNPIDMDDYVFFSDSFNVINSLPMGGVNLGADQYFGSDSTDSLANVIVSAPRLLARLLLEHLVPVGQDSTGDQFLLSITDGNFLDENGDPVPFTIDNGTVTVQAAAVPEPSAMSVFVVAAGAAFVRYRRKRRSGQGLSQSISGD